MGMYVITQLEALNIAIKALEGEQVTKTNARNAVNVLTHMVTVKKNAATRKTTSKAALEKRAHDKQLLDEMVAALQKKQQPMTYAELHAKIKGLTSSNKTRAIADLGIKEGLVKLSYDEKTGARIVVLL